MEHSKYVAFMMLCNNCSRGWSLSEEEMKKEIIPCQNPECDNQLTIYEGVKNGLKRVEDHISPNSFLSNDMYTDMVDIKIGYTKQIKLANNIKKVFKVHALPIENFLVGIAELTNESFSIFSSLPDNGDLNLIGKESKVMLFVHAKTEDYSSPWLHILQYAMDQLRSDEYLTSILLSEIAFETFVDTVITAGYLRIGLDQDSISRLLVAADMPNKVNPLMKNLYDVKLSSSESWSKWQGKVLRMRNDIAHGTKVAASKDEAKLAYETVIDSIFHLAEGIDTYLKSEGLKSGIFFRLD